MFIIEIYKTGRVTERGGEERTRDDEGREEIERGDCNSSIYLISNTSSI